MAANVVTVNRIANLTTDAGLIDTVTLNGSWPVVEVVNRSEAVIFVTSGTTASPPVDPDPVGEAEPVLPGERFAVRIRTAHGSQHVVKVIGSSSAYSVVGGR